MFENEIDEDELIFEDPTLEQEEDELSLDDDPNENLTDEQKENARVKSEYERLKALEPLLQQLGKNKPDAPIAPVKERVAAPLSVKEMIAAMSPEQRLAIEERAISNPFDVMVEVADLFSKRSIEAAQGPLTSSTAKMILHEHSLFVHQLNFHLDHLIMKVPDVAQNALRRYQMLRILLEAFNRVDIINIIGTEDEAKQKVQQEEQQKQQAMQMAQQQQQAAQQAQQMKMQQQQGKGGPPQQGPPQGPPQPPQPPVG